MGISTLVLLFYILLAAAKLKSVQANAPPTLSQRKQESPIRTMKWKFRRQHAGPDATNASTDQPSAPAALVHLTDEELREEMALILLQDSSDLKGVCSVLGLATASHAKISCAKCDYFKCHCSKRNCAKCRVNTTHWRPQNFQEGDIKRLKGQDKNEKNHLKFYTWERRSVKANIV